MRLLKPFIKKITVERNNVSNNIKFTLDAKDMKIENGVLIMDFDFSVDYGGSKILLESIMAIKGSNEEIDPLIEYWKNNKKLREDFFVILYNFLITSLINKIAMLADIVELPLPINLPLLRKEQLKNLESNRRKNEEINNVKEDIDKDVEELNEKDLEKIE